MKLFELFLVEFKQIPWNGFPEIGWWEDLDKLTLYHGTHVKNVNSVSENGLTKKDPDTGMISLALEPNTAYGYASMSGGESNFRKAGQKAQHVPASDRAIFKFEIPMTWIQQHMDKNLSGNVGPAHSHMRDKQLYTDWMKKHNDDQSFYATAEIRVKSEVPPKFIKGYMIRGK